ncbi:MAG: DUF262 domain-containing protein, partial [Ignavibacteria bacterium]|nr:DUF262 domain-containing protein [Ignavibacteria bacterium]
MKTQKYSVNQHLVETILSWVTSGEIAIPEIQRPFVWDSTKVRDLMDSLYQGYPIGYLIAWRNPDVRLKDGTKSHGKKILIDGQQRVTALTAAVLGQSVINQDYKRVKIQIAFHPIEEKFEVYNTAIAKNPSWISDISQVISGEISAFKLVENYCNKNENISQEFIFQKIEALRSILKKQIGLIELEPELEIEVVTEIFIRINSQGVVLSQADFAMSKIASNATYGGADLRKCIDYFCHLSIAPEFYNHITEIDKEFAATEYFQKISWLKNEKDDLYDPSYSDVLRVAFTSEFNRGRLSDLVSLLSGRNFETKTFEEEIAENSFATLKKGIFNYINETNFKKFVMIIRSAGFISQSLIRSQNALSFAYIVYLKLRALKYNPAEIESYVRKWFVLSISTGRYSGSPESMFDLDIRSISSKKFGDYLKSVEDAELSDAFWNFSLVQRLDTSVASSPLFGIYLASQIRANDKGFLSKDITVSDLVLLTGDVHHLFPKDYLKRNGKLKTEYNQVANYALTQEEINIKIGNKAPNIYLNEVLEQCNSKKLVY